MAYHTTSNWLGEPCRVRLEPDPDEQYELWLIALDIENAIDGAQMKLFPRSEPAAQRKGVA